jgi:ABC-type transport system involved in multi-copper enzyme maturation permease subunit
MRNTPQDPPFEAAPSFLRTLAGMWTLTWRSRLKVKNLPGLCFWLLALPGLLLAIGYFDDEDQLYDAFLGLTTMIYLLRALPILCLVQCGSMMREEVANDTLGYLTTRPASRARLYWAKYLCNFAWLQALLFLELLFVFVVGTIYGLEEIWSIFPWMLAAQIMAITAYSAMTSLLGVVAKNYIVWGIVYGLVVEIGVGRIPTNINTLSMTRNSKAFLAQSESLAAHFDWTATSIGTGLAVMAVVTFLSLAAGGLLFTWKEFLHSSEAESQK